MKEVQPMNNKRLSILILSLLLLGFVVSEITEVQGNTDRNPNSVCNVLLYDDKSTRCESATKDCYKCKECKKGTPADWISVEQLLLKVASSDEEKTYYYFLCTGSKSSQSHLIWVLSTLGAMLVFLTLL